MKKDNLCNFNFEKIEEKYFISNDFGNYLIINSKDFKAILNDNFSEKSKIYQRLKKEGFLRDYLDFEGLSRQLNKLMPASHIGPSLHIIVVTLKCNHSCLYCRAISHEAGFSKTNMSFNTAQESINMAFESPNSNITLEFQGGEALINWSIVKRAVKYAKAKNKKIRKNMLISLVSNLSLMDTEKCKFLSDENISVCTSLDGPEFIHNKNRVYLGGNSHAITIKWLKEFFKKSKSSKGQKDSLPSALMTTTKYSLGYPKKIVDEYYNLGFGGIFLRPLSPIGYAKEVWGEIGYSPKEYIKFYEKALDYILKINKEKGRFVERTAAIILRKILKKEDPNYLDLRSPCGGAIGQMAYNYNGDIYTCDEGRMVAAKGDTSFRIGNVKKSSYEELIHSDASKLCIISSCLENQVKCFRCAFKPFCGVCPVHNYETQNSPWGNMAQSDWCEVQKGIFKIIIRKLQNKDYKKIFENWFE
ncbi:MAG: His-Xaa-Ser system radical SAM maturase HxsB [Elusimicrobiota bacterium]|nr:His-Xaa-Ser system radical SAM maturase HxsB [Elusimicrobiota bacterium]